MSHHNWLQLLQGLRSAFALLMFQLPFQLLPLWIPDDQLSARFITTSFDVRQMYGVNILQFKKILSPLGDNVVVFLSVDCLL